MPILQGPVGDAKRNIHYRTSFQHEDYPLRYKRDTRTDEIKGRRYFDGAVTDLNGLPVRERCDSHNLEALSDN
jgi:hypothetical protein